MRDEVVAKSLTGRDWVQPAVDEAICRALAQRFDLPDVAARLLAMRGVGLEDAEDFLSPRLRVHLPDPSGLRDMDRAAERLADAVRRREPVGVITDYDVDGCTSAALLLRWGRALGLEVRLEIPHRLRDGYGPNAGLFDAFSAAGIGLVLVLDSGTNAFAAIGHACRLGLEVIVVDHHAPDAELPPALAVINPKRSDDGAAATVLAAVGVTFLLLVATNRALRRGGYFETTPEPPLMSLLDLVALGTVADVVPLLGVNRALVSQGLRVMATGANVGIAALAEVAGLRGAPTAAAIGFGLAPRLNAAGRLDEPKLAAELLVTDDHTRAAELAIQLDRLNRQRRAVEDDVIEQALAGLQRQLDGGRHVLLAVGDQWHPGVLGIVAGRLAERFHRPVLVGARREGEVVGSARAPDGFDLGAALREAVGCGLASKAGGHARAGGFTVPAAHLEGMFDLVERKAAKPSTPTLRIDAPVAVGGASPTLLAALDRLEPFG